MLRPSSPSPAASRPWRSALLGASIATLDRPALWPIALAGFLARGGIVVFLLPIVILPTPSGVADVIAPALTSFAFGLVSPEFVAIVAAVVAFLVGSLVLGGLAGAWADVELIAAAASEEEVARPEHAAAVGGRPRTGRLVVPRAFAARFLAHLPLWLALAWGAVRIVEATYAELVTPFEVVTPLAIRVLAAIPETIALVVAAWVLGEAAAGLAVRRVVLDGASVVAAAPLGWVDFVRRPVAGFLTLLLTDLAVLAAVLPAIVASTVAWTWVRLVILGREGPLEVGLAIIVLVALWLGGLVLAAVATAWRSLAWTAQALGPNASPAAFEGRRSETTAGTFGGPDHPRPGGWSSSDTSGRL